MFGMESMFFKVEMPLNFDIAEIGNAKPIFSDTKSTRIKYEVYFQSSSEVNKAFPTNYIKTGKD